MDNSRLSLKEFVEIE
uniref:Uncharacterized protein n=1 Tax=Schistosoma haematobium TaxID=6185 RepID=A0A095BXN6_SCHHA